MGPGLGRPERLEPSQRERERSRRRRQPLGRRAGGRAARAVAGVRRASREEGVQARATRRRRGWRAAPAPALRAPGPRRHVVPHVARGRGADEPRGDLRGRRAARRSGPGPRRGGDPRAPRALRAQGHARAARGVARLRRDRARGHGESHGRRSRRGARGARGGDRGFDRRRAPGLARRARRHGRRRPRAGVEAAARRRRRRAPRATNGTLRHSRRQPDGLGGAREAARLGRPAVRRAAAVDLAGTPRRAAAPPEHLRALPRLLRAASPRAARRQEDGDPGARARLGPESTVCAGAGARTGPEASVAADR